MSKIALVVEIKMNPGTRDAFVERVRRHAALCLDREPGCLTFDILVPTDGSERVFLYEIYSDQAAVEAHLSSAHMAEYQRDTKAMIAERIRTPCALLEDWRSRP